MPLEPKTWLQLLWSLANFDFDNNFFIYFAKFQKKKHSNSLSKQNNFQENYKSK